MIAAVGALQGVGATLEDLEGPQGDPGEENPVQEKGVHVLFHGAAAHLAFDGVFEKTCGTGAPGAGQHPAQQGGISLPGQEIQGVQGHFVVGIGVPGPGQGQGPGPAAQGQEQ